MSNVLRRNLRVLYISLTVLGGLSLVALGIILHVQLSAIPFIKPVDQLAKHPDAVLILGAGIEDSGQPSDALADRLLVGERVSSLLGAPMLLTGDGGAFREAEIPVMHKWLLERGAAPDRFILDDEGFRTYESCRRASQVYRLKRIVLITQRFHLGRAIYLCRSFGLEAYGVPANIRPYKKDLWFVTRDLLSSLKAWFDINVIPPQSPVAKKT
ncbi:YdcF family protein [Patescibacteria group bacterium]|nr:YdcF family protein [Patescibacteria group bacterium]